MKKAENVDFVDSDVDNTRPEHDTGTEFRPAGFNARPNGRRNARRLNSTFVSRKKFPFFIKIFASENCNDFSLDFLPSTVYIPN